MKVDGTARKSFVVTIGAAAAALALAGCGGGSSSPSASPGGATSSAPTTVSLKACDLLTPALAETVLGKPAKKTREAQPNPRMTQCQYTGKKAVADLISGECNNIKDVAFPDDKPVAGVGDYAVAGASGMVACKGDIGLQLNVGIIGSFSGAAADKVTAQELKLESKLANAIFAANG